MTSPTQGTLVLTQEIKDLVNGSLESGNPILLAAVDAGNRPVLSFRGSTQVHGDDSLGLWVRNAEGGTIAAISQNPLVALMYRPSPSRNSKAAPASPPTRPSVKQSSTPPPNANRKATLTARAWRW